MELNRSTLQEAVDRDLLTEQQAEQIWAFLSERTSNTAGFYLTHVLYYLGGLIAIAAMSLFNPSCHL